MIRRKINLFNQMEERQKGCEITIVVKIPFIDCHQNKLFRKVRLCVEPGRNLYELLMEHTELFLRGCNRGTCGKCRVLFVKGATLPTALDRSVFSTEELREGFRLACKCIPRRDCEVEIHFVKEKEIQIVTKDSVDKQLEKEKPEENILLKNQYVCVVDVGTTTLAMQLRLVKDGSVCAEYATLNPQVSLGQDVITRLKAANDGFGSKLQEMVLEAILFGKKTMCEQFFQEKEAGIWSQIPIFIAGNTTMIHLAFGLQTKTMAVAPFTPESLHPKTMVYHNQRVYALPGYSTFVGADIMADMYALGEKMKGVHSLLVDLGTNAEMILSANGKVYGTATAAGSAFEGGNTKNVIGTDLIHVAAMLLEEGNMDSYGLMREPFFEKGFAVCDDIVTQNDMRELQKAKAAIRSGIDILCKACGCRIKDVDKIFLCGGFGSFLNIEDSVRIGMFPEEYRNKIEVMGNCVLRGCYLYARKVLIKQREIKEDEKYLENVEILNLANEEIFEKLYIEHMNFGSSGKISSNTELD